MVTGYSFTKRLIVFQKDPFNKQWTTHVLLFSVHALLSSNNWQFTVQGKASLLADIHRDSFDSCQVSLLVKFSDYDSRSKARTRSNRSSPFNHVRDIS